MSELSLSDIKELEALKLALELHQELNKANISKTISALSFAISKLQLLLQVEENEIKKREITKKDWIDKVFSIGDIKYNENKIIDLCDAELVKAWYLKKSQE